VQQSNLPGSFYIFYKNNYTLIHTLLLLLTFIGLEDYFNVLIPEINYNEAFYLNIILNKRFLLFGVLGTLLLATLGKKRIQWSNFEHPKNIRLFITMLCIPLTWYFALGDYNYFHNDPYLLIRLVIIATNAFIYFHPSATPLYTFSLIIYINQFHNDTPSNYSSNDLYLLVYVLILINIFLYWKAFTNNKNSKILLLLIFAIVGGHYVEAGVNKFINLEEPLHNINIIYFSVGAYFNGWQLIDFNSDLINSFIENYIHELDIFLSASALCIELLFLFYTLNRKIFYIAMSSVIAMHILILMTSGIFFYKWIWLDLLLMYVIYNTKGTFVFNLRDYSTYLACIVLIYFVFKPWGQYSYSTPLSQTYEVVALGNNGNKYVMSDAYFSPYDKVFAQARFSELNNHHQRIVSPRGTTKNIEILKSLDKPHLSIQDIDVLKSRFSPNATNSVNHWKYEQLEEFFNRFITNKYNQKDKFNIFTYTSPVRHITYNRTLVSDYPRYAHQDRIDSIFIYQKEYFYDHKSVNLLNSKKVFSFKIQNSLYRTDILQK